MDKSKSLYEIIFEAYKDGELPRDFSLPDEKNSSGLRFADGAMDGISLYHIGAPQITDEIRESIKSAVDAASHRDIEHAEELFRVLGEKIPAIRAIDELQSYIIENKDSLNAPDLYDCAARLMVTSSDRECVKFGMSMLELFNIEDNKTLTSAVELLGQCNEFTIFSVFIMSRWKDANERIFALAQRVHGWGRIHAVERLEPKTDEIKSWLLREGVNNDVLPVYSALPCWEKSDAETLLQNNDISDEDFTAIGKILSEMMDEGPCKGISALENGEEIIIDFLNKSKARTLSIDDYITVLYIYDTCECNEYDNPKITSLCNEILDTERCRELVRTAVKNDDVSKGAIDLAHKLRIDCKDDLMRLLENDFDNKTYLCHQLMDDDHHAKTIEIFRSHLPFESLLDAANEDNAVLHGKLYAIVQNLANYPLEGTDLIEFCLKCSPVRDRIIALNTLQNWVNLRQTPLETLLPETFHIIQRSIRIEPDNNVRRKMENLLNGEIDNN